MIKASRFITIEIENWFQTPSTSSLQLRHQMKTIRTILTTFYHMHHYNYTPTGGMVKCYNTICNCLIVMNTINNSLILVAWAPVPLPQSRTSYGSVSIQVSSILCHNMVHILYVFIRILAAASALLECSY